MHARSHPSRDHITFEKPQRERPVRASGSKSSTLIVGEDGKTSTEKGTQAA
jgi:hypothetical protein